MLLGRTPGESSVCLSQSEKSLQQQHGTLTLLVPLHVLLTWEVLTGLACSLLITSCAQASSYVAEWKVTKVEDTADHLSLLGAPAELM